FNSVLETAVRIYPSDPVANLNAANAAMSRGDYAQAEFYLNRIAEADADAAVIYARGMLAALCGDYDAAEPLLATAARLKVADAPAALEQVRSIRRAKAELEAPQSQRNFIIIE
ncbi:MAG: tetratricopeptide repeat protein, partial [Muribaculaceae bacterium]|nr:tetratricopeptide repeat protein [Muribaculaceae bacterium]